MHGQTDPSLYVLLDASVDDFMNSRVRLQEQYRAASIHCLPSRPACGMSASGCAPSKGGHGSRFLDGLGPGDTRIFESHKSGAGASEDRDVRPGRNRHLQGGRPDVVCFGETLVGERMPNLTYMVVFEDMAPWNEVGRAFGRHPDWQEIRRGSYYTVPNISSIMLRPTAYSQI